MAMSTTTRSRSFARFGTGLHRWTSRHRSLMISCEVSGRSVHRRTNRSRFATPVATMEPYRRAWSRSKLTARLPPIGTLLVRRARLPFPRSTYRPMRLNLGPELMHRAHCTLTIQLRSLACGCSAFDEPPFTVGGGQGVRHGHTD